MTTTPAAASTIRRSPAARRSALLICVSLAAPAVMNAQAISTVGIERAMHTDAYWRLTYENDFFGATDRYYTQGVHVEVVHPRLRLPGIAKLLFAPKAMRTRFGVAFEDDGYTSSDLKQATIPLGDHPYAGTKQLRAFVIATDSFGARVTSSSLTVGIIGPGAGGREIQTYIHRRTGNTIPMGWTHQIRNDLILNYEVTGEQTVRRWRNLALLSANGVARVGTYQTGLTTGTTLMLGRLPALRPSSHAGSRALYAYIKPQLQLVGYDATLQGGMLNRSSPYTIATTDLSRAVYRQYIGLVYRSDARFVEFFRAYGSRTFRTGRAHSTGGIVFGINFR